MLMVKFRLESRVSVRYGHESSLFPSGRVWRETLNCLSYAAILPRNFSISARCRWCGTKLILTAHFCSLIVTALSIIRLMKVLMVNASTSVPSNPSCFLDAVHENLDTLNDYIDLKKKFLGLDKINMYDLYVPLTENFDMEIPYEKAQEIILEALKPLGEEYLENVKKAFSEGWIDV